VGAVNGTEFIVLLEGIMIYIESRVRGYLKIFTAAATIFCKICSLV